MNEKQYLRANKRVFLAVTIIFSYITLTMLAALAASHGDHFVRIMIQCLVSVGVIILSALGYLTRKKTHTCAIILDNRHDGRLCSCCFTKYHGRDMGLRASPHYCRHGLSE